MYKSGQRVSFDFDTSPLTFDMNAPLTGSFSDDEEEDEEITDNSASKFDYNALME
jgi:penicillin-binding protein 1A